MPSKIDPALETELAQAERRDPGTPIPVLVELATEATTGEGLAELEREVGRLQERLVARLAELRAGDVQPLTLANAVSVSLTPVQIREVAGRDDVALVRLARAERVTT